MAVTAVVAIWRFFGWQGALAAAAAFLAALSYGKGRAEGEAIIEAEQKEKRDALQAEYDRIDAGPVDPGGAYDRLRDRSRGR
ncbi:hypothetical protein [Devosia sp. LjRoot3]|uniref:hypothetical protein n=1 Tax=Devosia sp. LjRoot3 TaxID=3342319 RepID=UPI003ECC34DB